MTKLTVNVDAKYWKDNFPDETPLVAKEDVTTRGFHLLEFSDVYGQECSLQNSSLATQGAIWFGVDNTGPHLLGPGGKYNEQVGVRMHLSRKQVEQLLPFLHDFVEHGHISFEG